jgi:hypothetical protein
LREAVQGWRTRGIWGNRDVRVGDRRHGGRHRDRGVGKVPYTIRVTNNVGGFSGTRTNSLTGWLYDNLICLVEPAVAKESDPVCWTCSIKYS